MLKIINDDFIIIKDPDEEFPYVIAPTHGSIVNSRKRARKAMLEAGAKPFRFRPNDVFYRYACFGEEYIEHPCFYFDFSKKKDRKTLRQIEGAIYE